MWPVEKPIEIIDYPYEGDYCHKDGYHVYAQCMTDKKWNYYSDYCNEITMLKFIPHPTEDKFMATKVPHGCSI